MLVILLSVSGKGEKVDVLKLNLQIIGMKRDLLLNCVDESTYEVRYRREVESLDG